MESDYDENADFEFGLNLILDVSSGVCPFRPHEPAASVPLQSCISTSRGIRSPFASFRIMLRLSPESLLFHAEFDGADRVGHGNRKRFCFVQVDKSDQEIQFVALRGSGFGGKQLFDSPERGSVVILCFYQFRYHQIVPASIASYQGTHPCPRCQHKVTILGTFLFPLPAASEPGMLRKGTDI